MLVETCLVTPWTLISMLGSQMYLRPSFSKPNPLLFRMNRDIPKRGLICETCQNNFLCSYSSLKYSIGEIIKSSPKRKVQWVRLGGEFPTYLKCWLDTLHLTDKQSLYLLSACLRDTLSVAGVRGGRGRIRDKTTIIGTAVEQWTMWNEIINGLRFDTRWDKEWRRWNKVL